MSESEEIGESMPIACASDPLPDDALSNKYPFPPSKTIGLRLNIEKSDLFEILLRQPERYNKRQCEMREALDELQRCFYISMRVSLGAKPVIQEIHWNKAKFRESVAFLNQVSVCQKRKCNFHKPRPGFKAKSDVVWCENLQQWFRSQNVLPPKSDCVGKSRSWTNFIGPWKQEEPEQE